MTSTASGFKFTRSLWRYLQGHWWLALLTALTMLLCGPVLTYFGLKNLWSGEAQMAVQQKEMLDFMTFGAFFAGAYGGHGAGRGLCPDLLRLPAQ